MDHSAKQFEHILITGATGEVGSYASLFMARTGICKKLTLASRHARSLSTVQSNAQTIATMRGFNTFVEIAEMDLSLVDQTAQSLAALHPDLIINCATGISLYPYFPAMRRRQKKMGFIPGFAHTLPKDMAVLYPLMKAIKQSVPQAIVVNLSAPDLAGPVLYGLGLAPQIGAGTLDSTSQGVALSAAKKLGLRPNEVTVRMVAHHALRRFPAHEVPFVLTLFVGEQEVTDHFTESEQFELINFATDVTGVETMNSPVSNNASITASSAVETAYALFLDSGIVRHGSGLEGMPGSAPVALWRSGVKLALPQGITRSEAFAINTAGMHKDGVESVKPDGTVIFTQQEQFWIKSLGLSWTQCPLDAAQEMSRELLCAYERMRKEETV